MYYPNYSAFEKLTQEGNLIPVYREILADMETPVSVLMKLQDRPCAFLLESVEGGEKWGRYTFLGADPQIIFTVQGEEVIIERDQEIARQKHGGDPLRFLRELIGHYRPVPVDGCPRFYGGAVGFLGYDMVRYFESLPDRSADDLQTDDAVFFITDTMIIFDNVRHTIKVVACAFTGENDAIRDVYNDCTKRIDEMLALLSSADPRAEGWLPAAEAGDQPFTSNMSRDYFEGMVKKAKEYIVEGDIIQVVLSQRFEAGNDLSPLNLYRALRYVNPSPYLFFLKFRQLALIGSSPRSWYAWKMAQWS